ncbi:MAG: 2-C-methyl-D-erythritol 2,4-cyclodiphosphate synthase [Acidimicrobiia bacterium]
MRESRSGIGYDAHAFGGEGPLMLCGVEVEHSSGLVGTSDADVAVHAVCDAMLGAAAIGDIGQYFPSSDPQWKDANSLDLARQCMTMLHDRGFELSNVDVTIVAESVRVSPHREQMRQALGSALSTQIQAISIKATTTDGLGWIGRDEGIAAMAIVTLQR